MFLTQEKALRRIVQDRMKGERTKALEKAKSALERWPGDLDIAMEAIQLCLDMSDLKEAASLMKSTIRRHPKSRQQLLSISREALQASFNPFLASFVIEFMIRSRDFDSARHVMRAGPPSYIEDMIKRSETRSRGFDESGGKKNATYTENELLLGLLLLESNRWSDAAGPLGRALKSLPEEAKAIGGLLLEAERECRDCARIQYFLGIASILLAHPDKAEARFFRSLELEDPPAADILKILEVDGGRSKNWMMLQGEALTVAGRGAEGAGKIRDYLETRDGGWDNSEKAGGGSDMFPGEVDRHKFALERLERMPAERMEDLEITLLYAELAAGQEKVKEAVAAVTDYFEDHPGSAGDLAGWLAGNEAVSGSSPGQELLARLNLRLGMGEAAAEAAGVAAEIDKSRIPYIIEMIQEALDSGFEDRASLLSILAELYARGGNEERASELIREMESQHTLEEEELLRLSGEVLRHCGVSLDGVISNIELGIRNSRIAEAVPYMLEFYRENTDAHGLLAERIAGIADSDPSAWPALAELCELFAAEEELDRSMRFLRARAHMKSGQVERAVFEFDQLMMFDDSVRSRVTGLYEEAAVENPDNTTLHLAIYQIYFEDGRYASAAKHLGRAMETDPGQIRDIVPRFEKIVEKDPANRAVWDEMLGSAMRIRHFDLSRALLQKAVAVLPEDEAAALHIFGARIAAGEGNVEDALRCVEMTMRSSAADLGAVRSELEAIVEKEPSNAEARYLMGETMLRLGSEDDAVSELERCITLSPAYLDRVGQRLKQLLPVSIKPWLISRILGEICWAGSQREAALKYLESAQKGPEGSLSELGAILRKLNASSPDDADLALIYARNLALTGGFDDSARLIERLLSSGHPAAAGAVPVLRAITDRQPGHIDANRLLASIYSASGEDAKAVDALLKIASTETRAYGPLIETIEPFLDRYGSEPGLLVPLGGLRGKAGDQKGSLEDLEKALAADGSTAAAVLENAAAVEWTKKYAERGGLLEADCLISMGSHEAAFSRLREIDAGTRPARERITERIRRLIESGPRREYYEFAAQVMSGGGDTERAESILREGIETLGGDDAVDLLISMGGIFEAAGMDGKAADCFREVLESSADRHGILVRIEKAWMSWREREIRSGLERIEAGDAGPEEAERLVRTAIEAGDLVSAGRMIDAAGIGPLRRKALLARLHLSAGRTLSALAVAGSAPREGGDEESVIELLYIEGAASEMIGDAGRASAAWSRILGMRSDYLDAAERASRAYAEYISSQFEDEPAGMLTATGDLDPEK